ncbi:MAG: ABC transporter permease, partial [Acidobacteria bacterium]|nr:ABC transporter permease [Acidobacteriota bacterium]
LTLALGIGANTAIFTLIHAVMLRSLPVVDPGRLYSLGDDKMCCVTSGAQDDFSEYSYPLYLELRDHLPELPELAAFQAYPTTLSIRRAGSPAAAAPGLGEFVSSNYFAMFGIGAFAGRTLAPEDDRPASAPVAVMSYHAWRERYGLDPGVLGATFLLAGLPVTVVGVAPPGFFGDTLRSDPPDFWLPLAAEPLLDRSASLLRHADTFWLYAIGRLRPGARPAAVQAHVTAVVRQWLAGQPWLTADDRRSIGRVQVALTAAGGGVRHLADEYAAGLRLLMVVSALLLMITCANIANLLLARGLAARGQTAVRLAIGAARGRIVRQTLTEGVLLAALGGIAGLGVAFAGTRAILALAFRGASFVPIDPNPSLAVLGFTALVCLLTGVVFSVVPAAIAARTHPAEPLRGGGRAALAAPGSEGLPQRSLVVLQATLSLVLLAGAGLLTASLRHLEDQRMGFGTAGRMIAHVDLGLAGTSPARLATLYREVERRLTRLPGVESASLSLYSPMEHMNWSFPVSIEGAPIAVGGRSPSFDRVSAHYFETIGTRLLRGRTFDERDTPAARRVAVVNQTFARQYLPGQDPLGKHLGLELASHGRDYEIVGVVEDAKYVAARMPARPMLFLPLLQDVVYEDSQLANGQTRSNYVASIQLRVAGQPRGLQAAIRRTLAELAPSSTVIHLLTFDEQVRRNFNGERLVARLTTLYGLLALVLACTGLYGVASYAVVRRTREIGLRMALGADRAGVVTMVLRGALRPIALGLLLGVPVALAGGRAIASQLFGVRGSDPAILTAAVLALAVCALFAAWLPARRSAAIEPMAALRAD